MLNPLIDLFGIEVVTTWRTTARILVTSESTDPVQLAAHVTSPAEDQGKIAGRIKFLLDRPEILQQIRDSLDLPEDRPPAPRVVRRRGPRAAGDLQRSLINMATVALPQAIALRWPIFTGRSAPATTTYNDFFGEVCLDAIPRLRHARAVVGLAKLFSCLGLDEFQISINTWLAAFGASSRPGQDARLHALQALSELSKGMARGSLNTEVKWPEHFQLSSPVSTVGFRQSGGEVVPLSSIDLRNPLDSDRGGGCLVIRLSPSFTRAIKTRYQRTTVDLNAWYSLEHGHRALLFLTGIHGHAPVRSIVGSARKPQTPFLAGPLAASFGYVREVDARTERALVGDLVAVKRAQPKRWGNLSFYRGSNGYLRLQIPRKPGVHVSSASPATASRRRRFHRQSIESSSVCREQLRPHVAVLLSSVKARSRRQLVKSTLASPDERRRAAQFGIDRVDRWRRSSAVEDVAGANAQANRSRDR